MAMRPVDVALRKWGLRAVPPAIREQSTARRAIVNRAYGLDLSASIPIARRIHAYNISLFQANILLNIAAVQILLYNFAL